MHDNHIAEVEHFTPGGIKTSTVSYLFEDTTHEEVLLACKESFADSRVRAIWVTPMRVFHPKERP